MLRQLRKWKVFIVSLFLVGLTLSMLGGGRIHPPKVFFLHNSKTPGDIKKKLSDFNFKPLMDISHIFSITNVVRCCHSNLLFSVCHIIFWVEKTKKLELFSRQYYFIKLKFGQGAIFRP